MNRSSYFLEGALEFSDAFEDLEGLLCVIARTDALKDRPSIRREMKAYFDKNSGILNSVLGYPNLLPTGQQEGYEGNLNVMSKAYSNAWELFRSIPHYDVDQIREEAEEILNTQVLFEPELQEVEEVR